MRWIIPATMTASPAFATAKNNELPDVAIAQQIGRDRCSYHPDDDRPPSRRNQGRSKIPEATPAAGQEHGSTIDRLQQCKVQPRG